ncbi:MAG: porin [Planctomycetaceae bacterium]|jgi:hypothetical protein|nr:porin [Planctomycetaceae bacterium]
MRTRLIIIVTIIITIFYFIVLRPSISSANNNLTATVINSPFPEPAIFQNYQQPAINQPSPPLQFAQITTPPQANQQFAQPVNQSLSNTHLSQISTSPQDNQPFAQPVNQSLSNTHLSQITTSPQAKQPLTQPPELSLTSRLLSDQSNRQTSNQLGVNIDVPVSFAAGYRKVTGPIIYDVAEGDGGVCGTCDPVVAPPVCGESVCGADLVVAPVCEPVCAIPNWWSRVKFYGWLQGGLYANSHGSTTQRYNGINRRGQQDLLQTNSGGNGASMGNVRQTGPVLNQLWLGLSRELDLCNGFDWGFRGEFLFGTDARLTQSYGDATFDYWTLRRDYSISIPQLYVTLGYMNLSVKIGKFESLLGYEHIQATESPFYSHSNLFYAEPQSHSGVIFDYNVYPDFWITLGYVQGADSTLSNRFGDNGIIGGFYWRCCPSMTLWYTLYYANHGAGAFENGEPHVAGALYRHTVVINWKLTARLDYAFQWDLGNRRSGAGSNVGNASYFGWAQYFTYKIHSRLTGGIRIDQLHSNTWMATSGFARPYTGNFIGDLFGITIGFDWKPYKNLSFKPELRYDYSDTLRVFGEGRKRDQIAFGFGIVYDF